MSRLLVLGAGVYQVPLIEAAHQRGHFVLVASIAGPYPGLAIADEALEIDTTDRDRLIDAATRLRIDGVVTSGTDVALPALGALVDRFGFVGPSAAVSRRCADKVLMKERFEACGVPTAHFVAIPATASVESLPSGLGYPVMVKAPDSSGSRGIHRVDSDDELSEAIRLAREVSRSGEIVIEEFLDGVEFGAQAFVVSGEVHSIVVHDDDVTTGAPPVPIGHTLPPEIDASLIGEAEEVVRNAITAMEIDNTAVNVDLMATSDGIKVIEIATRIGATCLPELVAYHLGIDVYGGLVDLALGNEASFRPRTGSKRPISGCLVRSATSGLVTGVREATFDSQVLEAQLDVAVGDHVTTFSTGNHRIGHVVAIGSSAHEARSRAADAAAALGRSVDVKASR